MAWWVSASVNPHPDRASVPVNELLDAFRVLFLRSGWLLPRDFHFSILLWKCQK